MYIRYTKEWPREKVELFTKRFHDGASASILAKEFGISRGAACGKLGRLGLFGHTLGKRVVTDRLPGRIPGPNSRRPSRKASPKLQPQFNPENFTPSDPVAAPNHRGLILTELTATTCRWPLGDPASSDFVFCGAPCDIEQSYCSFHRTIAYRPRMGISRESAAYIPQAGRKS